MEPLQNFGHRDSSYQRPNEDWVCGWACEGDPCQRGPSPDGRCPMQSHCEPVREGDRYHCTLPATAGGPCEKGPRPDGSCCHPKLRHPPCQPQRSIRSKRRRASWAVAVATLAVIAIALGGSYRMWFLSPGDLSSAHASISHAGMSPGQSCAACHAVADDHGPGIVAAVTSGGAALQQSQQCLTCHFTGEGEADHALHAHGLPPDQLDAQTEARGAAAAAASRDERSAALILASLAPSPMEGGDAFACAQCHQEHRGRSFDMTHMSDARCQSCHTQQFHSFSEGHPEFAPAPSSPAIHFDHAEHEDYFSNEAWSCARCHGQTERTTLKPFEQSCASCHANNSEDHHGDQIRQASLTVFEVPELEVEEGGEAGEWPMEIATGFELPLVMRLLLVSDEAAIGPLQNIRQEFWEPGMWFPDDPADATGLALAIKQAMRDLLTADQQALAHRLSVALAVSPDDPKLQRVVQEMVNSPLADQLENHPAVQQFLQMGEAEGDAVASASESASPSASEDAEAEALVGWILGDNGAVEYHEPDHADPFYKALLDLLAASADNPAESADETAEFRATVRQEVWQTVLDGGPLSPFTLGCLKCHNTDGDRIAWQAPASGFRHPPSAFGEDDPHLVLSDHHHLGRSEQCFVCHSSTDADDAAAEGSTGENLAEWLEFKPITHESCASCHNEVGARESCLTCHSYHHQ